MNTQPKTYAEDIIEQVPWCCGESDCATQWHLGSYWIYSDGTYGFDAFTDGDHDPVDTVPGYAEVCAAWHDYYQHVAETGDDPCGTFAISVRRKPVQERWQFRFAPSILGVMVTEARRRGLRVALPALPAHVIEFLNLRRTGGGAVLDDFRTEAGEEKTARERFEEATGFSLQSRAWRTITIERPQYLTEEQVRAANRKAARRALQHSGRVLRALKPE